MAPPAKIDSPLLVNVFGTDVKEIGETVRDFDFKKIVVGENASDAYLHTELAPSFGGALEKESLKDLDNKLKIVIAATLKQLGMMTDKSWTETMSNLMQNSFLVPEDSVVDQADSLVKETKTSFLLEGSQADVATVKEVKEWFDKLLKDEDVIESTQLDFDVLSKVVSQAGTVIQDWFAIQEKQHYEQPLIDIGVLRFPDAKRPYFKLYHIKLTAWVDSARILTQKTEKNGFTGKFVSRSFRPRESIIDSMSESARAKAIATADAMIENLSEYSRARAIAVASALFDKE